MQSEESMNLTLLEQLCKRNGFDLSILPIDWLKSTDFFRAPASTKWHAAYRGGLFDHSYRVANNLVSMTKKLDLKWGRPESPIIIGMLHDATKIDTYIRCEEVNPISQEVNIWYVWNPKRKECSSIHGLDSVTKIMRHMELTDEEWMCIRWHMGAYETESWDEFDSAIREYPNVLWTHTADMLASKVQESIKGGIKFED